MLEQPVVGSADEAHPGPAAPRSGVAQAMVTPELGAQATFWLRPVDPVPAPGTVRFDAGFHRAGQQPQHSGEAAMGGTTVHRPFVPTPEEMLDPNRFTVTPSWSEDAFEVERALIAGRLPPGFDSSRLMRQWPGLVLDTEIEDLLESGLLPTRAIDSMIERFRAVEGGRGHIQLIQQLEAMKKSIDRALTKAYGYRVDADWLATVDRFLKTGRPAQDPLNPRPQVGFGEVEVVGLDATQPVGSLGAGGRGIVVDPTVGWQAAETPGFGRLASTSAERALSRREQMVHRLMTGEPLSVAQRSELIRRYERAISAGTIASPAPRARTAAALLEDLRRLSTAARVSPASAALEDIDWAAIEWMLRLLDAPGL